MFHLKIHTNSMKKLKILECEIFSAHQMQNIMSVKVINFAHFMYAADNSSSVATQSIAPPSQRMPQ